MSEKIVIKEGKTLKLQNTLIKEVQPEEFLSQSRILHMMNSYILSKGSEPTGPLINYSSVQVNEIGSPAMTAKFIIQLKSEINADYPYVFQETVIEKQCLFARFQEKEDNLQFAYQKLGVYAFENNIKLRGDNYTVFLKKDNTDYIIADVFMPIVL